MLGLPISRTVSAVGAAVAIVALHGCATGQDSFIAEPAGEPVGALSLSEDSERDGPFGAAAPNLLAASGTALLPGSRGSAAAALLNQVGPLAGPNSLTVGSPLANAAVAAATSSNGVGAQVTVAGQAVGAQVTAPLLAPNGQPAT